MLLPPEPGEVSGVVPGSRILELLPTAEEIEAKYKAAKTLKAIANIKKEWLIWLVCERYGFTPEDLVNLVKEQLAQMLFSFVCLLVPLLHGFVLMYFTARERCTPKKMIGM